MRRYTWCGAVKTNSNSRSTTLYSPSAPIESSSALVKWRWLAVKRQPSRSIL